MRPHRRVLRGVALIRPGRDADEDGFIALIAACWAEYPGCIMDVDAELPEVRMLASHYAEQGGALWTAEADGAVAGMIATRPLPGGDWEICRVYVHPSRHGAGLGPALLHVAEAHAAAAGARGLALWSDTRFLRAHRFYEKHGYVHRPGERPLHDLSNSVEHEYRKPCCTREASG